MESLTEISDTYLDYHKHTPEAYARVLEIMNHWEFMLELNTRRAKEELYVPSNVIEVDFQAKA